VLERFTACCVFVAELALLCPAAGVPLIPWFAELYESLLALPEPPTLLFHFDDILLDRSFLP
jgi:hypothetical protein